MAIINVGEKDFTDISEAASNAWRMRQYPFADRLDKIARKINAALSNQRYLHLPFKPKGLRWEDVPSTLDIYRDKKK